MLQFAIVGFIKNSGSIVSKKDLFDWLTSWIGLSMRKVTDDRGRFVGCGISLPVKWVFFVNPDEVIC